jgi:hypothetical protein
MSADSECLSVCAASSELMFIKDALMGELGVDQHRIAEKGVALTTLLMRKNRDYGCSVWHRPSLAPECDAGAAIRVRMSDKIARLTELLNRYEGPDVNESIDDTMLDLAGYILLELARPGR